MRITAAEARCIEHHAMALAVDYFVSDGWQVDDVSRYKPYDLHYVRGDVVRHVEVN